MEDCDCQTQTENEIIIKKQRKIKSKTLKVWSPCDCDPVVLRYRSKYSLMKVQKGYYPIDQKIILMF